MSQTFDDSKKRAADDATHQASTTGPDPDALKKQGAAATKHIVDGDGPSIFGMHGFPVGKPLYIVKGQVHGMGVTAGVSGNASIVAEDPQHLVVTLTQVDVKKFGISFSKNDTVTMSFDRTKDDNIAFSSDEANHHKKASGELHLLSDPSANLVAFADKDGKKGSISWDEAKQELTINYGGDNIMVLSPNKK